MNNGTNFQSRVTIASNRIFEIKIVPPTKPTANKICIIIGIKSCCEACIFFGFKNSYKYKVAITK